MDQENNNAPTKKVLQTSTLKIDLQGKAQHFDKLVPLNEHKLFIYLDNGDYFIYDLSGQAIVGRGNIILGVKTFYQLWENTLCFVDPIELKVRLINFSNHEIDPDFTFNASEVITANDEKNKKETVAEKLQLILVEGPYSNFLVTVDQQKQYSANNEVIIIIREIEKQYPFKEKFQPNKFLRYNYANVTGQVELFNWLVEKDTIALFGQDFETGQIEFLLIKPHLGVKGFQVVHVKEQSSFTLMNVTNWYKPFEVAIMMNNNEGTVLPSIDIIDLRNYFNYQTQQFMAEPEYNATRISAQLQGDQYQTFIDVFQFEFNQPFAVMQRLVGNETKIQLINWQDRTLISEQIIEDFNYYQSQNKSYIVHHSDNKIQDGLLQIAVDFNSDARYNYLKIMEDKKLIDKYGIEVLQELFDFYQ